MCYKWLLWRHSYALTSFTGLLTRMSNWKDMANASHSANMYIVIKMSSWWNLENQNFKHFPKLFISFSSFFSLSPFTFLSRPRSAIGWWLWPRVHMCLKIWQLILLKENKRISEALYLKLDNCNSPLDVTIITCNGKHSSTPIKTASVCWMWPYIDCATFHYFADIPKLHHAVCICRGYHRTLQ